MHGTKLTTPNCAVSYIESESDSELIGNAFTDTLNQYFADIFNAVKDFRISRAC